MSRPVAVLPQRLRTSHAPGVALAAPAAGAHTEDGAPMQWVHLIPAGTFTGRDGRGPYTLDAEAVLAAFAAHGADLPVDYEHQSLDAETKAGPVPAAGWIVALESRADGLWAQVRWTARAAELLAAQEYRYLSPVFRFDPATGRVAAVVGAGLTHSPNLMLQAAASTGAAMEELLERLVYILNMPVTSTPDDLVAELMKVIDALKAAQADAAAMRAELDAAKSAAQSAGKTAAPDPAQFVPLSLHKKTADALAALQAEVAQRAAAEAVEAAMRSGKLAPAMKDWALAYARADAAGFATFAESAPQIAGGAPTPAPSEQPDGLTADELEAARLLGMTRAAFAQAKQALAK